jgi:hypothetical protein
MTQSVHTICTPQTVREGLQPNFFPVAQQECRDILSVHHETLTALKGEEKGEQVILNGNDPIRRRLRRG